MILFVLFFFPRRRAGRAVFSGADQRITLFNRPAHHGRASQDGRCHAVGFVNCPDVWPLHVWKNAKKNSFSKHFLIKQKLYSLMGNSILKGQLQGKGAIPPLLDETQIFTLCKGLFQNANFHSNYLSFIFNVQGLLVM
jgi:hypothetical protein